MRGRLDFKKDLRIPAYWQAGEKDYPLYKKNPFQIMIIK